MFEFGAFDRVFIRKRDLEFLWCWAVFEGREMKFGEAFTEYLHHEKEKDESLANCSHIEYKRLKKVLKNCRVCRRSLPTEEAAMTSSPRPPQSAGDPDGDPRSDEEEEKECESCPCNLSYFTFYYCLTCTSFELDYARLTLVYLIGLNFISTSRDVVPCHARINFNFINKLSIII